MPSTETTPNSGQVDIDVSPRARRVECIDLVRGLAVVFMALDHTRDYFTNLHFEPENLTKTWPLLFLVRWITHFCAPAFFLLMGTGAFLYGRRVTTSKLRRFLITRGVWLIILEFTVVGFAWTFKPGWGMFGVIWALGASLLLLACLIDLPVPVLLVFSIAVILGHDVLDSLNPAQFGKFGSIFAILHRTGGVHLFGRVWFVLFPLIPWCAVTILGFCIGPLFVRPQPMRKRALVIAGSAALVAFVLLRLTNLYGNPAPPIAHTSPGAFHVQATLSKTAILFFDVEKYPPSLQYLLMTLGPIFLILSATVRNPNALLTKAMITFGRTPLFFYLIHLYVIHLLAIAVAAITHQPFGWLLDGAFFFNDLPEGYGHGVPFLCGVWVCVIALMYPLCRWYAYLKLTRTWRWLSYV